MADENIVFARKTKLVHPSGSFLETPFLIPSFSSKGFGFSKGGKSELDKIFDLASQFLFETMLVSAYDLSCGHLKKIENSITELTVVDSGGYEISNFQDISTVYSQPVKSEEWSVEKLKNVYDNWPDHIPAIFVNYDHPEVRVSVEEQIETARSFHSNYKSQLCCLLIKPETDSSAFVEIKHVTRNVEALGAFDIVGLTEKELGSSVLDRMKKIVDLRLAMDDAGLKGIPIHIFGSLDPLTTALYFISGAEIFDGLTWLRYAYLDGNASYQQNFGVRCVGIERKDDFVRAKSIQENLSYLSRLKNQMSKFLLEGDFAMFDYNQKILSESWDLLRTKVKRFNHGR